MFPHIPAPLFGGKASPSPAARVVPAAAATCALQALILSGNDIRDEGVVELCKRLQRNECLKVLDLSHNELTELAGEDLGSMIAHNVAMKSLVLQRCCSFSFSCLFLGPSCGHAPTQARSNCFGSSSQLWLLLSFPLLSSLSTHPVTTSLCSRRDRVDVGAESKAGRGREGG